MRVALLLVLALFAVFASAGININIDTGSISGKTTGYAEKDCRKLKKGVDDLTDDTLYYTPTDDNQYTHVCHLQDELIKDLCPKLDVGKLDRLCDQGSSSGAALRGSDSSSKAKLTRRG